VPVGPRSLGRRSFLMAAGAMLAMAACGGTDGRRSGNRASGDRHEPVPPGEGLSALLLASDLYASPDLQRFVLALAEDGDYAAGPEATISFARDGGTPGEAVGASLHTAGLPPGRGVYTVRAVFPKPGTWTGIVEAGGTRATVAFEVGSRPTAPVPGQAAPRAASPTVGDPMGVDPLCTRQPDCGLHEASLAALVGAGSPVALLFATPARCQSQYCGPVLDELLTQVDAFRDRVAFAHVEIYRAETGVALVPTVEAWGLPSEPWLFGIDAAGVIVDRLDGAFGADEIGAVLEAIA
jgi:hypothetical protein